MLKLSLDKRQQSAIQERSTTDVHHGKFSDDDYISADFDACISYVTFCLKYSC